MTHQKWFKVFFILFLVVLFLSSGFIIMQYKSSSMAKDLEEYRSYYFVITGNKTICKIDTVTNQIISKINVDGKPEDIQISPDGKILVVVASNSKDEDGTGFLLFYQIKDDKLLKKLEVGKHPSKISFTPDKKYALVANKESNDISLIDFQNYTILQSIAVGRKPKNFCISYDGRYCYVANTGEDTLSVVDMRSFKSIKKIRVGRYPTDVTIDKANGNVMVTLSREKAVALVNPNTENIEKVDLDDKPTKIYN
ncbi:cytochrome D1 domain-containing protein [Clostridium ljungdahlii]|uniref:YncE family protein n=1 Tax=Clostridium ljungdahlii TaxID=1538 RepID=UPI0038662D5C